jgi:hypothetical protein
MSAAINVCAVAPNDPHDGVGGLRSRKMHSATKTTSTRRAGRSRKVRKDHIATAKFATAEADWTIEFDAQTGKLLREVSESTGKRSRELDNPTLA